MYFISLLKTYSEVASDAVMYTTIFFELLIETTNSFSNVVQCAHACINNLIT